MYERIRSRLVYEKNHVREKMCSAALVAQNVLVVLSDFCLCPSLQLLSRYVESLKAENKSDVGKSTKTLPNLGTFEKITVDLDVAAYLEEAFPTNGSQNELSDVFLTIPACYSGKHAYENVESFDPAKSKEKKPKMKLTKIKAVKKIKKQQQLQKQQQGSFVLPEGEFQASVLLYPYAIVILFCCFDLIIP